MKQCITFAIILFFLSSNLCSGQKITKKMADSVYIVAVSAYAGSYYQVCLDNLTLYKSFYKDTFTKHPEDDTVVSVLHMIKFSKTKIDLGYAVPPPPPPLPQRLYLPNDEEKRQDSLEMLIFQSRHHSR